MDDAYDGSYNFHDLMNSNEIREYLVVENCRTPTGPIPHPRISANTLLLYILCPIVRPFNVSVHGLLFADRVTRLTGEQPRE